jgi:AGCS family alanine or glycine:cation symporter
MFTDFQTLLFQLNEGFTFFVVFPLVVLLGLYFTTQLRCVQLSQLKLSFQQLLNKKADAEGSISHYQAISAVLAGNFGTGNISGMAVALATGGPGALVWMWVMAFLGSAIQYSSCLLGVKYRQKNSEGEYVGGPMYYLSQGLGFNKLAAVFAILTLVGAMAVGNLAQVNSVILPLQTLGFNPLLCGIVLAGLVGIVLIGGMQRMVKLAAFVIPIKALIYLGTACIILALHADQVLPAFHRMFQAAFDFQSLTGGLLGAGLVKAISVGFNRGLFATDAGTGIVPILQAGAKTTHPVMDGIVALAAPFLVMIVCTATGLVLMVTGAWEHPELQSTNMVTFAFSKGLNSGFGAFVVIASLVLFAYTTILAWACCAEKALEFLGGKKYRSLFRTFYLMLIPLGTVMQVDLIWQFADLSIACMLVINLIGVACLAREVVGDSREYLRYQE